MVNQQKGETAYSAVAVNDHIVFDPKGVIET